MTKPLGHRSTFFTWIFNDRPAVAESKPNMLEKFKYNKHNLHILINKCKINKYSS